MNTERQIIQDWITGTGTTQLLRAAQSVVLRYPNLFDKNEDGSIPEIAMEAHHAMADLESSLVLLQAMEEKLESLEG